MEQMSMFDTIIPYPKTYSDVYDLYRNYIFEGESDDDAFTCNPPEDQDAPRRSYFFYGKKVFSFSPDIGKGSKLKIVNDKKEVLVKQEDLPSALKKLKERKHIIFRNTITETFACCNDFKRCSAVGVCIHPEDRFYNGCLYRKNLESGKNFYKEG